MIFPDVYDIFWRQYIRISLGVLVSKQESTCKHFVDPKSTEYLKSLFFMTSTHFLHGKSSKITAPDDCLFCDHHSHGNTP